MERSVYGTHAPGTGDTEALPPSPTAEPSAEPRRAVAQPVIAGLVTALVGYSASFALVVVGLRAVGADPRQAVSALLALCLAVGGLSLWFGLRNRQPICIAWSTPGAALLAAAGRQHGGYPAAVGAFAVAGLLIVLTGLSGRLVGWIGRIPAPITSALLAGVLLPLCLAPVRAAAQLPGLALGPIAVWVVLSRAARRWAAPAALAVALLEAAVHHTGPLAASGTSLLPRFSVTVPTLSAGALVGIALPLSIITMAAQNLPGQAVLHGFGYRTGLRPALLGTGAVTGPEHREAAAVTLAVSASGISVFSLGAPFWGLVCGLAFDAVQRYGRAGTRSRTVRELA